MSEFSRRTVMTGAAAATLAAACPLSTFPARAAAPTTGKQAPGFYRYKLGDFEVTALHDGAVTRPVEGYVRNISSDQAIAAAEAAYFPKGRVTIPFNPIVVNTGAKLVLIDAGLGRLPNVPAGMLLSNMEASGIDPKAIDIVILSHLHPDHINGPRLHECGDQGAGARLGVVDERRQYEQSAGGDVERLFPERPQSSFQPCQPSHEV
jgi:hypothetical protein